MLGFADTTYRGVHSFPATNAVGEKRFFKFMVVPVSGVDAPVLEDANAKSVDFLMRELEERIPTGDVRFSVMALLDRPGDSTTDIATRWPQEDQRESLRLGTIVVTGNKAEYADEACTFNPAKLAKGVGFPADEIFAARRSAYASSQGKDH